MMSEAEHSETLVLGSGEGGNIWLGTGQVGHRTAVIERKLIGGSCPNTNCLPSKNEIWSAKSRRSGSPRGSVRDGDGLHGHRHEEGAALIMIRICKMGRL